MTTIRASKMPSGRRGRSAVAKPATELLEERGTTAVPAQSNGRHARASEPVPATWYSAKAQRAERQLLLVDLYRADPMDRVELVKTGVPAAGFVVLASNMHMPKERLAITLGLARATVDRKIRDNKLLSPDESSRVLGMASLVGQVQSLVAESGETQDFDAGAWVSNWLEQPVPALGGRRPAELMDTSEGQAIVSRLVAQMQSGAYA